MSRIALPDRSKTSRKSVMRFDRKFVGVAVIAVFVGVFALKLRPDSSHTQKVGMSPPKGPAIILVRGDNSPGCRAIHGLVEQAARRYRGRIEVIQTDWSPDNPLIGQYQIRFLPAVVFIGRDGDEIGRIVGESKAVQDRLAEALAGAEVLLE
jgi:Thioredoxin